MLRRKERVLMFGAGAGATRAMACIRHRCTVVAFVDNDEAKHGATFLGRPVVAPTELSRFPRETIYVASMYAQQIYRQLTESLAVDPARVVIVRKGILEGAYEVSRWTYVALSGLTVLAMVVLTAVAVAIHRVVAG